MSPLHRCKQVASQFLSLSSEKTNSRRSTTGEFESVSDSLHQREGVRPVLSLRVSAAPWLLGGGGAASGSSAAPLTSDQTSSGIGCFLEWEQLVGLGCAALLCVVLEALWCARPPDFDLPLTPLPLLFLLMTKHSKALLQGWPIIFCKRAT